MSLMKMFVRLLAKKELDLSYLDSWEIKPYMKTLDVCAMDMKSFASSKEVRKQCKAASKLRGSHELV